MLYASDLGDAQNKSLKGKEDLPEEIPDLIAKILIKTVEKRLKRQLTYSFETKDEVLSRVRGRINHLTTYRKQLLAKGKVSCTFNELSINNVDAINDRVENHLDHYDFILSRAVTRMDKFYKLVNKNFRFNSSNKMKNGII